MGCVQPRGCTPPGTSGIFLNKKNRCLQPNFEKKISGCCMSPEMTLKVLFVAITSMWAPIFCTVHHPYAQVHLSERGKFLGSRVWKIQAFTAEEISSWNFMKVLKFMWNLWNSSGICEIYLKYVWNFVKMVCMCVGFSFWPECMPMGIIAWPKKGTPFDWKQGEWSKAM